MQPATRVRLPTGHPLALQLSQRSTVPVVLATALGYLLLLPPQLNATIGGSEIPPYRAFLIVASLYVLGSAARGRVRFAWPDACIGFAVGWICLAMSWTSPWQEALTASVAHLTDVGLAYFFARIAFRDLRDLRMFLIFMLPGLLVIGTIMALEAITATHIIQGSLSRLTGETFYYRSDPRLGLMRAQGPFPHPISAGIFFASFLPLYWLAGFKGWVKVAGTLASLCGFFSVSSAALLSLVASVGLLVYNWFTDRIANLSWRVFFILAGLFVFVAEFGTKSGTFSLLMRFGSLNTVSSYQRINIWYFGTQSVRKHRWFGIGYGDWERPVWMLDSVDNYWLLLAMRFGVLPSVLIALATVLAVILIMRRSKRSQGADQQIERGLAMSLSIFALGLISVAVWLSAQVWYFVLLGLTVSLASSVAQPHRHLMDARQVGRAGAGVVR